MGKIKDELKILGKHLKQGWKQLPSFNVKTIGFMQFVLGVFIILTVVISSVYQVEQFDNLTYNHQERISESFPPLENRTLSFEEHMPFMTIAVIVYERQMQMLVPILIGIELILGLIGLMFISQGTVNLMRK